MSASCVLSPSVPAAESGRHTPQICRLISGQHGLRCSRPNKICLASCRPAIHFRFKTLQVFSRVRIRQGIRFQAPPTKRCACFSCNTAQKEDIGKVKAWTHQTRGCIGTIPPDTFGALASAERINAYGIMAPSGTEMDPYTPAFQFFMREPISCSLHMTVCSDCTCIRYAEVLFVL
ncbi:TPA: hypothetical protein ACH3X1_000290 [Trebouxia sp. C0004]